MRLCIKHDEPASATVLLVRDAAGLTVEIPPGKTRVIDATLPVEVEPGRPFPGWDAWTAEHSTPPPAANPDLPPIAGRS